MKKECLVLIIILNSLIPVYAQKTLSGFGIEIPSSIINTKIDLPRLMKGSIQKVEGGSKYDVGIGATYQKSIPLSLRAGFHMWKVPFKPTVNKVKDKTDSYVIEDGLLTYYGVYLRAEYSIKYFFIGGGFDFSFANQYKADRDYYENNTWVSTEKDQDKSVLTDDFSNVFNIVINTGFKIPIVNRYIIKPFVSVGTSFGSIYSTSKVTNIGSTGVYYTTPQKVDLQYTSIVGYGVSLEYKL